MNWYDQKAILLLFCWQESCGVRYVDNALSRSRMQRVLPEQKWTMWKETSR